MRLARLAMFGLLGLTVAGGLFYASGNDSMRRLAGSSPDATGSGASTTQTTGQQDKGKDGIGKPGGDSPARKIPVVTVAAFETSMPLQYDSVGTVEATASVAIRARVDATIAKVIVKDGQQVDQGDVIIELDRRALEAQIAQAEAIAGKDKVQIAKARRDMDRARRLIAAKAGTRVTEEEAQTAFEVAEATLEADQAAIAVFVVQRDYYTLKAPISGRLGIVSAHAGALIRAGDQLASIVTLDPVYAALGLPQRYLADLIDAQTAGTAKLQLSVPGRPTMLEGPVSVIDNSADETTGLITIRARIDNPSNYVWPGEIVDVTLLLRMQPNALVVPNEAVQIDQSGQSVFVIDDQGRAHRKPIKVERTFGGMSIVAEGISAGNKVVIDGRLQLTDGAMTIETAAKAENMDAGRVSKDSSGQGGG